MYRIEVPGRMPTLNQFTNGRADWRWKSRMKRKWLETIVWHLKASKLPKKLKTPLVVNYTQFTKRKRDVENTVISLKYFNDALVAAGYIPDDNPDYVKCASMRWEKATGEEKTVYVIQPYDTGSATKIKEHDGVGDNT